MKLSIDLTPNGIAIALLAACAAVAVAAYTTRYPALPPRRRAILLGVRALTLFALALAALAPVFTYSSASKERNRLLVLVDHSGSMEVRDEARGRSRREAADSAAARIADDVGGRYDVRVAPFDVALGPIGRASSWKPAQAEKGAGETALGDALREALERTDPDSVAAILVLSDGAVNRGEDPERALAGAIPAFALVAGSTEDPPTAGISGVEVPVDVVVGRQASLTVTIRQGVRPAARGVARLSEGGRERSRAAFALEGPGASTRVSIPFTLGERGKHFLTVTLDSLPGDPLPQNKRRLIVLTARPPKRVVPLIAVSWDWDLRSFSRGVEEDTAWAVARMTPFGDARVAPPGGAPQALASVLDQAEAVAVRYDARTITPQRATDLLRYLERGGGVLFWIDSLNRPPAPSPLTNALGLTWRDWPRGMGPSSAIDLAPAGRRHELSLLGGDAASASGAWRTLPPVQAPLAIADKAGPLEPLLTARFGSDATPILLAGRVARGRVAILNAAGVYRWGLTASGLGAGAGVETSFFGSLCEWLSRSAEDRAVRIAAPDLTPAERPLPVRLTLSDPAAAADVGARVVARRAGERRTAAEAPLGAVGPGEFAGSVELPEGVYLITGRIHRGGRVLGDDSVRVAVGEQGIEYESLRSDPAVLERLARGSGGTSAPLSSPERVLSRLRSPDVARARLVQLDLFHNTALFFVLVLGATAEWVLRKRYHLL